MEEGEQKERHLEKADQKGVRYRCYQLLQNVRFNGEPVVPQLLSEVKPHQLLGTAFEVEQLEGKDLAEFLHDPSISLQTKWKVLLYIIRQFQAIDEAGYVLFDRHGGNIRVLEWETKISVRQMDIEDMYDKNRNKVYSSDGNWDISLIRSLEKKGVDPWFYACKAIANQGIGLAQRTGNERMAGVLKRLIDQPGSSLSDFEKALRAAVEG